jgi:hypothetical protein
LQFCGMPGENFPKIPFLRLRVVNKYRYFWTFFYIRANFFRHCVEAGGAAPHPKQDHTPRAMQP